MDEDQQPGQGAVSPAAGGTHLAPSSGAGSATPGAPSGGQPSPNAGGNFATLQSYLTANQGQAAPLANKITGGIQNQYNTLEGGNASTLSGIQNQVAQGTTVNDPNLLAQEAANPVSFASNPTNVQSFQKQLNDQYTGPQSAESTNDFANQQNAINKAIATGNSQTKTEAGREQLLQPNEARPTTGVTALNSALLTQDPNALSSIENAYKPFSNLLTGLQTGAGNVNQQITQAQNQAAQDRQAANAAITGQQTDLNTAINTALANAQKNATTQNAAVNDAFKNLYGGVALNNAPTTLGTYGGGSTPWVNTTNYTVQEFSPQAAAALGMTPKQATALTNALQQSATSQKMIGHNFGAGSGTTQLDLSQLLTQQDPNQAITTANIATPEQYAQEQAFQTLLGSLPTGAVLNPNAVAQAGTAPTNLNSFDYATALSGAQQTAAAERQAAQDEANAISGAADLAHAQSQHNHGILGGLQNAITHPFNIVGAVSNPASWLANAINLAKGNPISPTNMNPVRPTSINAATPLVNNTPVQTALTATTPVPVGIAHGGVVPKKEDYLPFKNLVERLPIGAH